MLDALSVPPKLVLVAVNKLPEVEHDLARRVDELETQITINALHAEIVDLRDKIPGI